MKYAALISFITACITCSTGWYEVMFGALFVLFVSLCVLACRLTDKIDGKSIPRSWWGGL